MLAKDHENERYQCRRKESGSKSFFFENEDKCRHYKIAFCLRR